MDTEWYYESACFVLHTDNKLLSLIYALYYYINDNKSACIELPHF